MRFLIPALPTILFFPLNLLPTTKFTDSRSNSSLANNSPLGISAKRILFANSSPLLVFDSLPDQSGARGSIGVEINCRSGRDPSRLIGPAMGVLSERISGGDTEKMTMIFTYGTLKRGFSNHVLMQELIATRDALFVGACRTAEKFPLVCGPYRVPFLLNKPGKGERVWGELYAVTKKGLMRMDELEGISRCHYERLPIKVVAEDAAEEEAVEAEAYFGHRNYAEEMWTRSGERGYAIYSEKEARGYVKRNDRPHNLTFLDHIRIFLTTPTPHV